MNIIITGLQIDRINNDKGYSLENCRWVTAAQNAKNRRGMSGTSQYKGVMWNKKGCKWIARTYYKGKLKHIGTFTCEKEAALAYNKKALELNGEYAYLNKIED